MKVVVVEDSSWMRDLLVRSIDALPNVRVVGVATDERQAVELIVRTRPGCVVINLNLADGSGLDTIRAARLQGFSGGARLLTFGEIHREYVAMGESLGFVGYYDKATDLERLKSDIACEASARAAGRGSD